MHHLQKLLLITIPKIVIYFNSLIIGLNNFIQEIDYFFITIRVIEIDNMQRVTLVPLKDDAAPLKKKVPYDQLRPYLTSELHDGTSPPESKATSPTQRNTTSPSKDDSRVLARDSPQLIHDSPPQSYNGEDETIKNKTNDKINNSNNQTGHNRANKNNTNNNKLKKDRKPNGVWKCTANGNPDNLVSTILKDDYWLSDQHIDHAQWLLSKQFPDANGLHSVLAFASKPPRVQTGDKGFVQILHVGGNHWVTATNIGCQENKIKVFDSLHQKLSKKEKQKLHSCLAVLLNTSSSTIVTEWPSMQRQRGESDCGLFAVAVAISLLNGEDPGSKSYDQSVMRSHLAVCFHCEELAVFPESSSKCGTNEKREETIEVFCHCRMPFRHGVFMIECCACLEWFHRSCEKVPKTVKDKTLFHCMNCK